MLEACQTLRDEFLSFQNTFKQPEVEVDQTCASASKPGLSNQAVTLDPPPLRPWPTSHSVEAMEVDYGPSLPPRLGADQFISLFGVLRRFQHCTGHTTMGSWKGRGNQYIQFVWVLYCKLPTNGKQLPASVLINLSMTTHWISIQLYPMNLLGWQKSILTLIKSMTLNRGPPRISIQVNPISHGLHHLDLKNVQREANTK